MNSANLSPEGLPYSSYRWIPALVSLPLGMLLEIGYWLMRLTRRKVVNRFDGEIPTNAILVAYHPDFPLFMTDYELWNDIIANCEDSAFYVGSHDFLSYVPSLFMSWFHQWPCFRYNRRLAMKPRDQLQAYLERYPRRMMAVRTDSGGPYNIVRMSVIDYALTFNRPIICFRQHADRYVRINQHKIPLPFLTLYTWISKPITVEEIRAHSREDALKLVQDTMDSFVTN